MLNTKRINEGFDKWWEQWMSTRAQSRIGVKTREKPGADVERTADPGEGNRVQAEQVADHGK
jgi:hypothetical protein